MHGTMTYNSRSYKIQITKTDRLVTRIQDQISKETDQYIYRDVVYT